MFWLVGGILAKRFNRVSDAFVKDTNYLVFTWTLPGLLFYNIGKTPLQEVWQGLFIGYAVGFILLSIAVLWWVVPLFVRDRSARGVAVQGAYRGNMNVVGLATVLNAFGVSAIPLASLFMTAMTILFNLSAVFVLQAGQGPIGTLRLLRQMALNPILIGVALGLTWSLLDLPMPAVSANVLEDMAGLALPLALFCIGASMKWQSLRDHTGWVLSVSALKLGVLPLIAVLGAILLGFRGEALGILYLMMAAPTAAASYVMASALTRWGNLAAEIIVVTTLMSIVTTAAGLFILRSLGLL